jgi:hypothetical protein
LQLRDAAHETGSQQKIVVGFVLDNMAHADEARVVGEAGEVFGEIVTAQVDPAHNALDEMMTGSEPEKPMCFFQGLPRLDGHAAIELCRAQEWRKVYGQKVAAQRPVGANPRILRRFVAPKMLMRIDPHHSTTTMALMTPVSGFVY